MFVKDHMRESLKNHVLDEILDAGPFKAFRMRKPEPTRIMSTLIIFTPEGIVITGDLCPRPRTRGAVSDPGYKLDWFAGKLSESYLCEKFLKHEWQREVAIEALRREAREELPAREAAKLLELADQLEREVIEDERGLYEELIDIGYETADGIPGYEYPLADAGWLCAIQQRFSELYKAPAQVAE